MKMWHGNDDDAATTASARELLTCSADDLTNWWQVDCRLSEHRAARARRAGAVDSVAAVDSRLVDGRWVLGGTAPAWFRGAECLRRGTPLAPPEAFQVMRLLAAGDSDDLEQLLRIEVRPDCCGGRARPHVVEEDPLACLQEVSDADVHWEPDGNVGVIVEAENEQTWFRMVERPGPGRGPRYVNALSLCQRRPAPRPVPQKKRARAAPLLPLSPKRRRSLLDAAHALAGLVGA